MNPLDTVIKSFDFKDESFKSFLRHIPAAVAVLDTAVRYIAVSDRWITDYGLKDQNIIGKSHYEIFPEILEMPEWLAYHQSSLKGAVHEKSEDSFPREDGSLQWIRWKIYPWYKSPNEIGGMIFYTEEITAEKEHQLSLEAANKKLTKAMEELRRKNQQLEEFAYITAHNVRAPATNLMALTKLYSDIGESRDKAPIIEQISTSSQKLVNTLDDLQKALIIRTNTEIGKDSLELDTMCQSALQQLTALLEDCHAEIELDFSQANKVRFPRTYLESIFTNLIANAIKYRDEARDLILKIGSYIENDLVHLYIEDNGRGIDLEKNQRKLFQMGKTFHKNKDARGMGLFMVKNQVDAMGGEVRVESQVNKGTKFTIVFK